ncbi:MAG TPA: alpha/beta fold hydrolase [Deltaproteobacteria bacterium]|nr:alpha/beta fold hydrolase [Deltaproteobacteria bacterium]HOI06445.1 alpha/beta fold hydrolase [Deltaproteobacteria bacterium]
MATPYEDLMKFYETALHHCKPEWATSSSIIYEDDAVALRRFDDARTGTPILIVPPQAGHHSCIADYSPDHSLVRTCLSCTDSPVYAIEWKSSTPKRKDETIDDLVKQMLMCVKMTGSPVTLAGLCQGGWLSAIYAALFPRDVHALILAASPIDFTAGGGKIQDIVNTLPFWFYQYMVACGCGNMSGDLMLSGWKLMNSYDRFVGDYLNLWINVRDESYHERSKRFMGWYDYTQDLPGTWYLQVVKDLFKDNKLIKRELKVFGRYVDLGNITCPLVLLAGEKDDITLIPQVHNMQHHASTPKEHIFKAVIPQAGHISVFMGKRALQHEWPEALEFIRTCHAAGPRKRASADHREKAAGI